jgi:hypothetical protein
VALAAPFALPVADILLLLLLTLEAIEPDLNSMKHYLKFSLKVVSAYFEKRQERENDEFKVRSSNFLFYCLPRLCTSYNSSFTVLDCSSKLRCALELGSDKQFKY